MLGDKQLVKIFQIIQADEPDHWAPYEGWLKAHGKRRDSWWERAIDGFIHSELLLLQLPILFFKRLNRFFFFFCICYRLSLASRPPRSPSSLGCPTSLVLELPHRL